MSLKKSLRGVRRLVVGIPLSLCAGMAAVQGAPAASETVTLSPYRLEVGPPASDAGAAGLNRLAVQGAAAPKASADGLRLDPKPDGGAAFWYDRAFSGNVLIRFRARWPEPSPSARLHCFFMSDVAQAEGAGGALSARPKSGYEVTLGGLHTPSGDGLEMTLNRFPGPERISSNPIPGARASEPSDVAIVKVGADVAVFVNGRPQDFWRDLGVTEEAADYSTGRVGFAAEGGPALVEAISVSEIRSRSLVPDPPPCDLHLQTDLADATVVVGSNPLHAELAGQLVSALEVRLGRRLEIVKDAEMAGRLPGKAPLIVLGNLADNRVARRLYCEWFCMVDKVFPGEDGYLIQTIHNPWGTGQNVVLLGASDDAGLRRAVERFAEMVPKDGRLGRVYEVRPAAPFAALRDFDSAKTPYLVLPLFWRQFFGLRNDAQQSAMCYLVTGDDRFAAQCRAALVKQTGAGLLGHLYLPSWGIIWRLMETHPAFSEADRAKIDSYLLDEIRSSEGMYAGLIQRMHSGMPSQNHGTRPALGCFFLARYFRDQYHLPEAEAYLNRIRQYFGRQADWSKPYCDSSMHQWGASLEDAAIYALASGETAFFDNGAARRAAERALRSTDNLGVLPVIGDTQYGLGADGLLSKAAFYYDDPRYLWPLKQRGEEMGDTDELGRGFTVHAAPKPPLDIIGVSVMPYDEPFWKAWHDAPKSHDGYPLPAVPFDRAFDKIAFRTGLDRNDEFLLLDGMISGSHDYDDTNTIHEYSRDGRIYVTTADNFTMTTMPHHNGVNIIRNGLSTQCPTAAERLYAEQVGPVMVSQTRVNDFADADWTRSVVLLPKAYFVVLDRMTAREGGDFVFTGHWRMLGDPHMDANVLTVSQCKKGERPQGDNVTFFHMQAAGGHVLHHEMPYRYSLPVRQYPYARTALQVLTQSDTTQLRAGASAYLYALGHGTGHEANARYRMDEVSPGVVRVSDGSAAAYVGAPAGPVRIGAIEVDADLFYLDATHLCVAGGRKAVVEGKTVLDSAQPVTQSIPIEAGDALKRQLATTASDAVPPSAGAAERAPALKQVWQAKTGGEVRTLRAGRWPDSFGAIAVPVRLGAKADKGKVVFLDGAGRTVREINVDAGVNDIAVADLDGDGQSEVLLAREDCELQCLDAAGKERFAFRPAQENIVNSLLWLGKNSMQRVWVADRGKGETTIVASSGDQRVHGLTAAGKRQWCFWSYAGIFTTFGLCDVDGDGVKEIVGGNGQLASSDDLWFLKAGDSCYKRIPNDGWGAALSAMAIGDLAGDGREGIVVGTSRCSLRAIDPRTATLLWKRYLGDTVTGALILPGDNGKPFVAAGSLSEFVLAFTGSGEKLWATPVGARVAFLAAVWRNEAPTLMAVCEDGSVAALDGHGRILARGKLSSPPTAVATPESARDLLCVAGEDGAVTALALP